MNSVTRNALNQYSETSIETAGSQTDPYKLILLLYEGALKNIATAKRMMAEKAVPQKGESISRAISIIEEGLRLALDKEAGGEIAINLDRLYIYMCDRLLLANADNEPKYLDEVATLLSDIKSAWEQIGQQVKPVVQPEVPIAPRGTLSYGKI